MPEITRQQGSECVPERQRNASLWRNLRISKTSNSAIWRTPPLRFVQPLRHRLATIVRDRHVDAAVDEELHAFVVIAVGDLVQDARQLCELHRVLMSEIGDVEMAVENGPGERGIERLLDLWLAHCRFPRVYASLHGK